MHPIKFQILLGILLFTLSVGAQEQTTIAVVDFFTPTTRQVAEATKADKPKLVHFGTSDYTKLLRTINTAESFVVETLVADQRFSVVERQKLNLVEEERERQKSEDFIEGYVVAQGKNIGAEYLVLGDVDPFNLVLTLSLYSVVELKTVEKKNINLQPVLEKNVKPRDLIIPATQEIIFRQFPPKILVVKELDGKGRKTKSVLISGGAKYGLRKQQMLEVKIKSVMEVDGEKLDRFETVAILLIKEVENEHFSKCEVVEGGDWLKSKIGASEKIYCFPKL